jgi:hypothetical protein
MLRTYQRLSIFCSIFITPLRYSYSRKGLRTEQSLQHSHEDTQHVPRRSKKRLCGSLRCVKWVWDPTISIVEERANHSVGILAKREDHERSAQAEAG